MQENKYYIIGGRKWLQKEITLEQADALIDLVFELKIFTEDRLNTFISGEPFEVVDIVNELREKHVLNKVLAIMLIRCPKTIIGRLWAFIRWILRIEPVGFKEKNIERNSLYLGKARISLAGDILSDFFTCNAAWVTNIAKSLDLIQTVVQSEKNQPPGQKE